MQSSSGDQAYQAQSLTKGAFGSPGRREEGLGDLPCAGSLSSWLAYPQAQSPGTSMCLGPRSEYWSLQRGPQIQEPLSEQGALKILSHLNVSWKE